MSIYAKTETLKASKTIGAGRIIQAESELRRMKNVPGERTVETRRVRCSGAIHRLVAYATGRIHFHNHTNGELRALKTLRVLGDKGCGCLAMVEKIVKGQRAEAHLKETFARAERVRKLRSERPPELQPGPNTTQPNRSALERFHQMRSYYFNRVEALIGTSKYGLGAREIVVGVAPLGQGARAVVEHTTSFDIHEGWTRATHRLLVSIPTSQWRWTLSGLGTLTHGDAKWVVLDVAELRYSDHVAAKPGFKLSLHLRDMRFARAVARCARLADSGEVLEASFPVVYEPLHGAWRIEDR